MQICAAVMVIVDISGYTKFLKLRTISLLHAEQIITDLLNEVIDRATYPLILNKLEGDAALLYAPIPTQALSIDVARDVVRQTLGFFDHFRAKVRQLLTVTASCPCDACSNLADLRLKAVIHNDEIAVKQVRHFEELGGEGVIVIHRLLKNSVPFREYLLLTEPIHQLAHTELPGSCTASVERDIDLGDIRIWIWTPASGIEEGQQAAFSSKERVGTKLRWLRRLLLRLLGGGKSGFRHLPDVPVSAHAYWQEINEAHRHKTQG